MPRPLTKLLWPPALTVCIFSTFLCSGIIMPVSLRLKKRIMQPSMALSKQLMQKTVVMSPLPTRTNWLVWDSGNTNALPIGVDYGFRVYATTNPVGPWKLYAIVNSHTNHVVLQIDNTNKVEFFRVAVIIQ